MRGVGVPHRPRCLAALSVPGTTTDQRLLDNKGIADRLHTDPWRVMRIQSEFVEGFGAPGRAGAGRERVRLARIRVDSPHYTWAGGGAAWRGPAMP